MNVLFYSFLLVAGGSATAQTNPAIQIHSLDGAGCRGVLNHRVETVGNRVTVHFSTSSNDFFVKFPYDVNRAPYLYTGKGCTAELSMDWSGHAQCLRLGSFQIDTDSSLDIDLSLITSGQVQTVAYNPSTHVWDIDKVYQTGELKIFGPRYGYIQSGGKLLGLHAPEPLERCMSSHRLIFSTWAGLSARAAEEPAESEATIRSWSYTFEKY
ncbi:MAG TPA: hypothetical protein VE954_30000 [Oligoflexus sp.]|uniref:hypothetical protein n=1 Tax=Oligoflexus sp. TaxID=1971216 RepID=UPI002D4A2B54|nr:hypothetical protein [Oligoflexus sp.]HYX37357.1 hypothetical protein [Oligoflexus sp.]